MNTVKWIIKGNRHSCGMFYRQNINTCLALFNNFCAIDVKYYCVVMTKATVWAGETKIMKQNHFMKLFQIKIFKFRNIANFLKWGIVCAPSGRSASDGGNYSCITSVWKVPSTRLIARARNITMDKEQHYRQEYHRMQSALENGSGGNLSGIHTQKKAMNAPGYNKNPGLKFKSNLSRQTIPEDQVLPPGVPVKYPEPNNGSKMTRPDMFRSHTSLSACGSQPSLYKSVLEAKLKTNRSCISMSMIDAMDYENVNINRYKYEPRRANPLTHVADRRDRTPSRPKKSSELETAHWKK